MEMYLELVIICRDPVIYPGQRLKIKFEIQSRIASLSRIITSLGFKVTPGKIMLSIFLGDFELRVLTPINRMFSIKDG